MGKTGSRTAYLTEKAKVMLKSRKQGRPDELIFPKRSGKDGTMAQASKVFSDEPLVEESVAIIERENSGLFKINASGIPQAIFRLTKDKKEISKHRTWDNNNVSWSHVQIMDRELTRVLWRYRHEWRWIIHQEERESLFYRVAKFFTLLFIASRYPSPWPSTPFLFVCWEKRNPYEWGYPLEEAIPPPPRGGQSLFSFLSRSETPFTPYRGSKTEKMGTEWGQNKRSKKKG